MVKFVIMGKANITNEQLIESAQKQLVRSHGNYVARRKYVEKVSKWFEVDWYDHTEEVGGLIYGYKDHSTGLLKITDINQFPNKAVNRSKEYKLPSTIRIFFKSLRYFLQFNSVIGEWHSHLSGIQSPSKADKEAVERKLNGITVMGMKISGPERWILGIACHKKGIKTYIYGINETTNVKSRGE